MKKENSSRSGGVLRFSTSLSSRDRRLVHEMATRNGFFHSSFRDAETELKFVAVSRTQKALEELSSSMKKPRSKFLFADTSDTMRSLEKSQITYGFEEYAKRLNASSSGRFDHPHRERVSRMANKPPSNLLQHVHQTETFTPHEGCVFVNTDVQLRASLSEVELETEIAVSVKSHFLRSYYGFACLIVLSTRKKTFVIDALALRHQISSELKSLFVSPRVLKVFHSGGKCIQTLSRDFGINVVHVFDTRCAARELNIKVVKLQSLLVDSCGILRDESKIKLLGDSVRLSHRVDWRFRPLSEQALAFPVIETKYLLFLFDVLSKRLTLMSKKEDNLSEESGEDLEISYCGSSSENEGGDDEEDDDWLDDVMEDLYGKDVDEKKEVKETENVERNLTSRDKIGLLGNDSVANVDSVDFSDDLPELVARVCYMNALSPLPHNSYDNYSLTL